MKRRRSSPRPKKKTVLNLQALEARAVPSHGDDFLDIQSACAVDSDREKCDDDGNHGNKSENSDRDNDDRSRPVVAVPVVAVPVVAVPVVVVPVIAVPVAVPVTPPPPIVIVAPTPPAPVVVTPKSGGSTTKEPSVKKEDSGSEDSHDAPTPSVPSATPAPTPPTQASEGKTGEAKASDGKQATVKDTAPAESTASTAPNSAEKATDAHATPDRPIALAERAMDKAVNAVPVNGPVAVQATDSRLRVVATTVEGATVHIPAETTSVRPEMAAAIVLEELAADAASNESAEPPPAAPAPAASRWSLPDISAADLVARFTPFDPAALDEQVNRFLDGLCMRQGGLSAWMAEHPWALWTTAALAGVTTVEYARRRRLPKKGTRFLSLSPFLTKTKTL